MPAHVTLYVVCALDQHFCGERSAAVSLIYALLTAVKLVTSLAHRRVGIVSVWCVTSGASRLVRHVWCVTSGAPPARRCAEGKVPVYQDIEDESKRIQIFEAINSLAGQVRSFVS